MNDAIGLAVFVMLLAFLVAGVFLLMYEPFEDDGEPPTLNTRNDRDER